MLDQIEAAGQVGDELVSAITPLFFAPNTEKRLPALPDQLRQQIHGFDAESLRRSIVPLGRVIFGRADALSLLPDIVAPKLVIAGKHERAQPPEESRTMAEILQTELIMIPGCGHTATLERPDAVNAALLRSLDRLGWGTSPEAAAEPRSRLGTR
jgi:pimeloyl-ACP methyl ester carboxylesterase